MADAAQDEALETIFPLPGGGSFAIEPTRALIAVDVDLGAAAGPAAKRAARAANLAALSEAARVLRLKGLGGLVVIDLAGRGHDGAALLTAAKTAFAPDNPGVAFGPISRFGTLELTVPRRARSRSTDCSTPPASAPRGHWPCAGPAARARGGRRPRRPDRGHRRAGCRRGRRCPS